MRKQEQNIPRANLAQTIKLTYVSALGMICGLASLPFEHPFDTLKTWMQSSNKTFRQSAAEIYNKKGIKGFYSGFTINCMRVLSKSAYRWPLNVYLISKFRKLFNQFQQSKALAGIATGLITAIAESGIICPFQRIKVWLMTSPQNMKMNSFFRLQTVRALYKGYTPLLLRQSLSWISFLGSQQYLKDLVYKYQKQQQKQYQLTTLDLTLVSILVCLCNTLCVMPADYIKTNYQKYANHSKTSLKPFILKIYDTGGMKLFYQGWKVKIIQYNINAFVNVQLFERVLRQYDRNH